MSRNIINIQLNTKNYERTGFCQRTLLNSGAVNCLPNLIAQRLVGRKPLLEPLVLLQHQVRHQPAEYDAALGVEVRVVALDEVVRVGLCLANRLDVLAAVEVEVNVRRLGLRRRGDGALALVGEVVGHDARRVEAAAREGGDEDGGGAEGLDLLGEVAEVCLVLVEGDVLFGLLVVVAELFDSVSRSQGWMMLRMRGYVRLT